MKSTDPNPCHNHAPYVDVVWIKDGYHKDGRLKMKAIKNVMTKDCRYSILTEDPRCAGCKWKFKKEV